METLLSVLLRQFVSRLWWNRLPEDVERSGQLTAILLFVGRASLIGLAIGGGIGLLLGKADQELFACTARSICGLGGIALFVIIATLFLDPDRFT